MTDTSAAGRWVVRAVWVDAGLVMVTSAVNGGHAFAVLQQPWLVGFALGVAVDIGLAAALTGDRALHLHGRSTGWGRALCWITMTMSLALNCAVPAWQGHWGVAGFHAFLPLLLMLLTEYARESGLAFHHLAEQERQAAAAVAAEVRAAAEEHEQQLRWQQAELSATLAGLLAISSRIRTRGSSPAGSTRQRRPAAKRQAPAAVRQQVDLPALIARGRALLTEQPRMGRPTLAAELGVKQHVAQKVLDAIRDEHPVLRSA